MKFFSLLHLFCVLLSVGMLFLFDHMGDNIRTIDIFLLYGVMLCTLRHAKLERDAVKKSDIK